MQGTYTEEVQAILRKPTASVDELKVVLGIGRGQAYDFVRQGRIKSLRIGSRILIPTSAIRALLNEDQPQDAA